jgi:hypothetical protein
MAGEWLPIDCNLGTKPEVLEVAAKQVYSWSQFRNVISETLREWAKEEEEGKDGTHP